MKRKYLLLVAIALLAAGAYATTVVTDYDHTADFSQYRTYTWAKVETPNSLWDERVKEAIDQALAAKGWTQVPSAANVSVVAVGITKQRHTLQTFYDDFDGWLWGGFGWTGMGTATTTVEHYRVGTLVVDMFDTRTKKLIWRGSASDILSSKPEKNVKKLTKAAEKMFEHFPPKSSD